MWKLDPKRTVFKAQPKFGRDLGYVGPPDEKRSLVYLKYIIVDTFARAVQTASGKQSRLKGKQKLWAPLRKTGSDRVPSATVILLSHHATEAEALSRRPRPWGSRSRRRS